MRGLSRDIDGPARHGERTAGMAPVAPDSHLQPPRERAVGRGELPSCYVNQIPAVNPPPPPRFPRVSVARDRVECTTTRGYGALAGGVAWRATLVTLSRDTRPGTV